MPPVWFPEKTGSVPNLSSAFKILRIGNNQEEEATNTLVQLKKKAIFRFYVSNLKKYSFVHGVVIWLWRNTHSIYVNISINLKKRKIRWQPLLKLGDYTKLRGLTTIQLVDAVAVETPTPKVLPESDQGYVEAGHGHYNAPAIYVTTISDGIIYGGSNLILTKDGVICHDLYDFERDYTSEELHGRMLIDPKSGCIRWLLSDKVPELLPVAAAFVDACATNYAHWLTEVLPRIAVFCAEERFNGIPIVVNDGLHKNIMESLFLVVGSAHKIITLTNNKALAIDQLYSTSVSGYVPFEKRTTKFSDHSHGVFNPQAFELIRHQIAAFLEKLPEQAWPEKVYLRRNSEVRKITNAAELEELLVARGYVIVEPERLTFLQQAKLFSDAKIIVGATGATFANIMLTLSDPKIFILISKLPDHKYRYWQNIACACGKEINYIFGKVTHRRTRGIHGDFMVNLGDISQFIDESEK